MKSPCSSSSADRARANMREAADRLALRDEHFRAAAARVEAARIELREFIRNLNAEIERRLDQLQSRIVHSQMALTEIMDDTPRLDVITSLVGASFNVPESAFFTRSRREQVVIPRQAAMYLARRTTMISLSDVGRYFGGRDHGTVMWAIECTTNRMSVNAGFKSKIEALEQAIRDRFICSTSALSLQPSALSK